MTSVRPFPGQVVGQDWAARLVTALSESPAEPGNRPVPGKLDPSAYDDFPAALHVYRQERDGVSHTGVVCELAIQAFVDGQVRGHEAVDEQRVEALVEHHRAATSPPALVTLLHDAGETFSRAVEATVRTEPIVDFDGPDGLRQTVWRVADGPATSALASELSTAEHFIADGHHRVAAALEEWRLDGNPADAGLLCVVHALDDLRLSAFHRRVTGPVDPAYLIDLLAPGFDVCEVPGQPATSLGSFGMYVGRTWFELTHRGDRGDGPPGLDVSVLESWVRTRLVRHTAGPSYTVDVAPVRSPVDELTRECDADNGALFTLAPPSLDVLTGLARAGEVMPPKTTYFSPKPCAGIFLRPA